MSRVEIGRGKMARDELGGFEDKLDGLFAEQGERGYGNTGPEMPSEGARAYGPKPQGPPPRSRRKSVVRTMATPLVLLVVLVGLVHAIYSYVVRNETVEPWEVTGSGEASQPPAASEPQPGAIALDTGVEQPAPDTMADQPAATPDQPEARFAIQVALCNSRECVDEFQRRLGEFGLTSHVEETSAQMEAVEVYSINTFPSSDTAQALADRINREYDMAGQAYVFGENGEFRISMGNFPDLDHAVVVKDTLNRSFHGEVGFTTRVWSYPNPTPLQSVVAGGFATRNEAMATLNRLVLADSVFSEAYVVER